jgi:hypothetical protein
MLISEHRSELDACKKAQRRAVKDALDDAETVYDDRVDKLKKRLKRQRVEEVKPEPPQPTLLPPAATLPVPHPMLPQSNSGMQQQQACAQMMQQMMSLRRFTPREPRDQPFNMMAQMMGNYGSRGFHIQ